MEKLFIVRKYIMAKSAQDAIKKDKTHKVDDVYMDSDWRTENLKQTQIGYGEN